MIRNFFLHIPKTGCNWVRAIIKKSKTKKIEMAKINKHATFDLLVGDNNNFSIKELFKEKKINFFCTVRNPLTWYESWFKYQTANNFKIWGKHKNLVASDWHCIEPLNMQKKTFNEFIKFVNKSNPGFLTHLYYSYTISNAKVIKFENLKQEFLDLNKQWDMGIDEKLILNEAKINVSPKLNIIWSKKNYIETVENERSIFRKYNYSLNYKNIINIE